MNMHQAAAATARAREAKIATTRTRLPDIRHRARSGFPERSPFKRGLASSLSEPDLLASCCSSSRPTRSQVFLDKELGHHHVQSRRNVSKALAALCQDRKASEDILHLGRRGLKGFRQFLIERFGSIIAGWRALDPHNNGRLCWEEFAGACRELGFHGNMKTLWGQVNAKGTGYISVMDLDPKVGEAVGMFKLHLLKEYGDLLTAWLKGLDRAGTGCIHEEEVVACCQRLGLKMDGRELYLMLKASPAPPSAGLTLKGFDPDAHARWVTSRKDVAGVAWHYRDPLVREAIEVMRSRHASSPKAELEEAQAPDSALACLDGSTDTSGPRATEAASPRPKTPVEVKAQLRKALLDASPDGRLGESLEKHSQGLTQARRAKSPFEVKAHLHNALLDASLEGRLEKSVNKALHGDIQEVRAPAAAGGPLPALGDEAPGGAPPVADDGAEVASPKAPAAGAEARPREASRSDVFDVNDLPPEALATPKHGRAKMWRNEVAKREFVAHKENFQTVHLPLGLQSVDAFRKALLARYGKSWCAWRLGLDPDGRGHLTFTQFCRALSRLGYHGDINGLWSALDWRQQGFVSFEDVDPETAAPWDELRGKLVERHGNMMLAWLHGLDPKGSGKCYEGAFVQHCADVGFGGDAKELFVALMPPGSRTYLTLEELDIKAYLALGQGDFLMLTEQEEHQRSSGKGLLQMSINERTDASFFFQSIRAREKASRQEYRDVCRMEEAAKAKPPKTEQFRRLCVRHYGSMVGAWRRFLDKKHCGRLAFAEFCSVVRAIGYTGDVKALWMAYDANRNGYVSLYEMDPEADKIIRDFVTLIRNKFPDLESAWRRMGKDPSGYMHPEDLAAGCKAIGYPHNPSELFACIQTEKLKPHCTMWDVLPLYTCPVFYGEPGEATGTMSRAISSQLGSTARSAFGSSGNMEGASKTSTLLPHVRDTPEAEEAVHTFRAQLTREFGSTAAGWRLALDPRLKNSVQFGNFKLACEKCCWAGKLAALWSRLSAGRTWFSFQNLDPAAQETINEGRTRLLERYSTLKDVWEQCLDFIGAGHCDRSQFINALQKNGIELTDPGELFDLMLIRLGQRSLRIDDLEGLLVGVPKKRRQLMWGYFGHRGEPIELKEKRALLPIPKEAVEAMVDGHHSQDRVISSLDRFKRMLLHKFGTYLNAWRVFLDPDHNGLMTRQDFSAACDHLGIRKAKTLWTHIDLNMLGQITLGDLDAETAELLSDFEGLLVGHYGHVKKGWFLQFDTHKAARVGKEAFVSGCESIGFAGDAARLFDLILPDRGYPYLKYEDIWFDENRNSYEFQKWYKQEQLDFRSPLGNATFKLRVKRSWDAYLQRKGEQDTALQALPEAAEEQEVQEEKAPPGEPTRNFVVRTVGESFEVDVPEGATVGAFKALLHQEWQVVGKLSIFEDKLSATRRPTSSSPKDFATVKVSVRESVVNAALSGALADSVQRRISREDQLGSASPGPSRLPSPEADGGDERYVELLDESSLWDLRAGTELYCSVDAIKELEARVAALESPGCEEQRYLTWLRGVPGSDPRIGKTLWALAAMAPSAEAARNPAHSQGGSEHYVDQVSAVVLLALEALWDTERALAVEGWEERVVAVERGAKVDSHFIDTVYHEVGVWPWRNFEKSLEPHYSPLAHERLLEWLLAGVQGGRRSPHLRAAFADFHQINARGPINFIMNPKGGDRLMVAFESLIKFASADDDNSEFLMLSEGVRAGRTGAP